MQTGNGKIETSFPEFVAVIGGGRWARVLLGTICSIAPSNVKISIHTKHNITQMQDWLLEKKLDTRVTVSPDYPNFDSRKKCAVIVVNAARDHQKAIQWALEHDSAVLVEKPMTLSTFATNQLVEFAKFKDLKLAPAHIFLFNDSLKSFKKVIEDSHVKITSIKIFWEDPRIENRYGERKSYDSSLPIHADLFPHIVSVLENILPNSVLEFVDLKLNKGGASIIVQARVNGLPCEFELVRDGTSRNRRVEIKCSAGNYSLNFSTEPGVIELNGETLDVSNPVQGEKRPSEQMLSAFFNWVSEGIFHHALNADIGLKANKLIDQAQLHYDSAFSIWLIDNITSSRGKFGEEIRYGLKEFLQDRAMLSEVELENQIEQIQKRFADKDFLVQLFKKDK